MSDSELPEDDRKWWWNSKTGAVEHGVVSAAMYRVGPFDTREEAEHAPETLQENSRKWAAEDD
ncbi:MAG: SPOR domain-containing protein [Microbacteriaceae bacterium]|nr:SPOR domain-containing protein [Microbacteriaceae bacterium]MCL2795803.1 SPOR domain-containing protein [Microbacteriaceae bacterium]